MFDDGLPTKIPTDIPKKMGETTVPLGESAWSSAPPTFIPQVDGVSRIYVAMVQECFPGGYTPVTANTTVALGNLLLKHGAGTAVAAASGGEAPAPAGHASQVRSGRVVYLRGGFH